VRSADGYKKAIVEAIAGVLRPAGFKKSGAKFSRAVEGVIHLVTLQSSQSSTADSAHLTVNLGIWLPALDEPGGWPDIWQAHWQERIGFVMPAHGDVWWDVGSETEAAAAATEIARAVRSHALPTFDALSTVDALIALWRSGRSPGQTDRMARLYLEMLARKGLAG
jgi:hypothetical protein